MDSWKPGQIVDDRYEVVVALGSGAMGSVFKAKDLELGRIVALKLLNKSGAASVDHEAFLRMQREAQALSKLDHPSVVAVFAMNLWHENIPYLVLEFVEGTTLKEYIKSNGPVAWPEALRMVAQLCSALQAAHDVGIIHRDVKPENILLAQNIAELRVKLADFGLCRWENSQDAKLTQTGNLMGSAYYMAPEIPSAGRISKAVDIYSLGCVIYEILTGKVPFDGQTVPEIIYKHCNMPAPRLHDAISDYVWPGELEKLIQGCLEKNPDKRSSLEDLKHSLAELQQQGATNTLAARPPVPARKAKLGKKVACWSAASAVLISAIACFFLFSPHGSASIIAAGADTMPVEIMLPYLEWTLPLLKNTATGKADFSVLAQRILELPSARFSKTDRIKVLHLLKNKAREFGDKRMLGRTALEEFAEESLMFRRLIELHQCPIDWQELILLLTRSANELQTGSLNKSDWRRARQICEQYKPIFLNADTNDFFKYASLLFRFNINLLLVHSLEATIGSGPREHRELADACANAGADAKSLGYVDEACKLWDKAIDENLFCGSYSNAAHLLASEGMGLLQAYGSKANAPLLAEAADKSSKHYIKEPYQNDYCAWYCAHYFSNGEYANVVRFMLPRMGTLRKQCTKKSAELDPYMLSMHCVVISLCRIGEANAASELVKEILAAERPELGQKAVDDLHDKYVILSTEIAANQNNKSKALSLAPEAKLPGSQAHINWALAQLGLDDYVKSHAATRPAPPRSELLQPLQEGLKYYGLNLNYYMCSFVDSLVKLRTSRNEAESNAAIAELHDTVTNFPGSRIGSQYLSSLDPKLFSEVWIAFKKAAANLPQSKLTQDTEKSLRRFLELREVLEPGSDKVALREQQIGKTEWNKLWKSYLEGRVVDTDNLDMGVRKDMVKKLRGLFK